MKPIAVDTARNKLLRHLFLGFMRVHVLHHAAKEPIFGLEMREELRRHGYAISPGTLYPMLHALEESGALRSSQELIAGKVRRTYRTTKAGDALLAELRPKVRELVHEVLEEATPAKSRHTRRVA